MTIPGPALNVVPAQAGTHTALEWMRRMGPRVREDDGDY
jgi:hypothetical protein